MIQKRMKMIAAALLLAVACTQLGSAQMRRGGPQRWTLLGEANVDGTNDHDLIRIGQSEGRFRSIQLAVQQAPISFQRVVVHYGNGADEEIQIRSRIPAGGKTRIIDLRGNDRVIQGVEVWYSRANYSRRRPKLLLYGR